MSAGGGNPGERLKPLTRSALVIYLMAGDDTPKLAAAAVEGGADIVEIGFPFSDPLADGPVIRAAAEKALAAGMRTAACLECLAATRALVGETPLIPMTYASLLEAYGWERFEADARAAGATSFIVADTAAGARSGAQARPARRADLDRRADRARGRRDGRLALPRHADRARRARGTSSPMRSRDSRARARALTDIPLYAGFGISTPEQARAAADLTDGIVVGSRAVHVAEEGPDGAAGVRRLAARRARRLTGYFDCTRAPQRSQRWKRSVRKNQRAFGTRCPNSLQRQFTAPLRLSRASCRCSPPPAGR